MTANAIQCAAMSTLEEVDSAVVDCRQRVPRVRVQMACQHVLCLQEWAIKQHCGHNEQSI